MFERKAHFWVWVRDGNFRELVSEPLLWAALMPMRKRSAEERYALCCVALAAMTLMPVATALMLYEPVLAMLRNQLEQAADDDTRLQLSSQIRRTK